MSILKQELDKDYQDLVRGAFLSEDLLGRQITIYWENDLGDRERCCGTISGTKITEETGLELRFTINGIPTIGSWPLLYVSFFNGGWEAVRDVSKKSLPQGEVETSEEYDQRIEHLRYMEAEVHISTDAKS